MNAIQIEMPVVPPAMTPDLTVPPATHPALLSNGLTSIRRFSMADIPALHEATRESIHELSTWMLWCHQGYSLGDCAAFVAECGAKWDLDERYSFVIFDAVDGTFLGSAGLSHVDRVHNIANLGYWVRTSQTSRGIASVAARLVARFGLRELGFNRLELVVPVGNRASQRVAEKAGARYEGQLRNRLLLGGKAHDAILYSFAAEDFEPGHNMI